MKTRNNWIEPNGDFCHRYTRKSTSEDVNALLDVHRSKGLKEWQLPGFNGCWSCDNVLACCFGINAIAPREVQACIK